MTVAKGTHDGPMNVDEQWSRVRGRLRAEFGEAAYKSWLRPLKLSSLRDGKVIVSAPTPFMREWVMSRYADRIRAIWHGQDPSIQSITISVHDDCGPRAAPPASAEQQLRGSTRKRRAAARPAASRHCCCS